MCALVGRHGRSLFGTSSEKCRCHVVSLLEPPRRPTTTSVAGSAAAASVTAQCHVECNSDKTNSTSTAGALIHGIASRLRARSTVSVKYNDDDDDSDVDENCGNDKLENDIAGFDDDEDFDICDDADDGNTVAGENIFPVDNFSGSNSLDALNHKSFTPTSRDGDIMDDRRSSRDDADDAEWTPKKSHHKKAQPSICMKLKLKTDPELDSELNSIQNDAIGCEVVGSCELKQVVHKKRGRKPGLTSKSLAKKWKHVGHRKKRLLTDAKTGIHAVRSKDGPKWEKKASILFYYIL